MATITTSSAVCFQGGTQTTQKIVGFSGGSTWLARYSFTTDSNGASSVSWILPNNSYLGGGSATTEFRWYITTESSVPAVTGTNLPYHGVVSKPESGGAYQFSGSANIILLPNTTYYLRIFPGTTTYGYFNLTSNATATVTTSGSAGVVYIDNGSRWDAYQCYIDNGSSWDLYIPYIDNGSSWSVY